MPARSFYLVFMSNKSANEKEKKPKITKGAIKKSMRLYKYIKPYRRLFSVGLIFLVFSSAASLAFPKYLGDLVDAAGNASPEIIKENIQNASLILIGVLIAQAIASFFRVKIFVNVTEKSLASLRQATYAHLIKLPVSFFNVKRVGELNSRISSDISILQETFTITLAEFIRQIIIIFGGITILLFQSPQLTLFMLSVVPLVVIIAVVFGRFIRKFSKDVQKNVAESNTIVEETLQGIFNVKAYTHEFLEILRYTQKTNDVAKVGMKGGTYRAAFSSFIVLGIFGTIVAVLWRGANLMADGELPVGELISFLLYSGFIGGSIGGLANVYSSLQKAIGATEELLEIFDEPIEELNEGETQEKIKDFKGRVEIKDLSFSYPSRPEIEVLKKINLTVNPGEQIAIVGPSGSGKSTLVSLLLRLYKADSGALVFDGKNAEDFGLSSLRNEMAIVPQDVFLFGGSIRENILYGKPGASEEEIIEAAKQANAWEYISNFPEGLDTIVGERGVQLSGGQRQRVAIARAVLKNPKILILDEATSALDAESENLVQSALEELMKGRTSIVIAHRLATIRKANKIVVIENGEVIETGSHDELVKIEGGLYRNLSELQFVN